MCVRTIGFFCNWLWLTSALANRILLWIGILPWVGVVSPKEAFSFASTVQSVQQQQQQQTALCWSQGFRVLLDIIVWEIYILDSNLNQLLFLSSKTEFPGGTVRRLYCYCFCRDESSWMWFPRGDSQTTFRLFIHSYQFYSLLASFLYLWRFRWGYFFCLSIIHCFVVLFFCQSLWAHSGCCNGLLWLLFRMGASQSTD